MRASITLDVEIRDAATLYERAVQDYRNQNTGRAADEIETEIADFLGTPENPKIDRCLIQLFDNPQASTLGLETHNSSVTSAGGFRTSTVFHVSTRHLTAGERRAIRDMLNPMASTEEGTRLVRLTHAEHSGLYLKAKNTGFLVRVPSDDRDVPLFTEEMKAIIVKARTAGAWMIDFDDDEPTHGSLPVFDEIRLVIYDQDSCEDDPVFWSNEDGWVDRDSASIFTPSAAASAQLPLGGTPVWVEVDDLDNIPYLLIR